MRNQAQQVIEKLSSDNQFDLKTVSAFTAPDFREGVQWLVQNEKHEMAQALAEAGLALYPLSEDLLAISGLLAMTRKDWPLAIELLEDLVTVQKDRIQPVTCQMLARSLACNLDITEAFQVLNQALNVWPGDALLESEKQSLSAFYNIAPGSEASN